ncbi:MAG: invasion associated locus B family protein [Alphaproteobacteria bacterium]
MKQLFGRIALAATLVLFGTAVPAQEQKQIGQFGDWTAYESGAGADRFCYLVSSPQSASLKDRRGDIFFLIWHRPNAQEFDVVQVDVGYSYKVGTEAEIVIGNETWSLFTRDGNAWTFEGKDDAEVVQAMRKGRTMTIKGRSSRDNDTTDSYSLSGVTAGHNAINRACER